MHAPANQLVIIKTRVISLLTKSRVCTLLVDVTCTYGCVWLINLQEEPGSGSATTVTYYSTMELNGWEVQKLDRFLQEGQGMAREVMREKPDDFVRDETRREFLVLRLYDHLLLRLDATHVSRAGRVCADRLWDSSPPCVSDR